MLENQVPTLIAIVALFALAMSGTSAYVLYKWVRPIVKKGIPVIEKAGQFLEKDTATEVKKIIENDAQHMIAESMELAIVEYAPRMQKAMMTGLDAWARPVIQESMDALGDGISQAVGGVVQAILQHEGAQQFGKQGGIQKVKNAQLREGKKQLIQKLAVAKGGPLVGAAVAQLGLDEEFLDLQEEHPEIAGMIMNKLTGQEGQSQSQPTRPARRPAPHRSGGWYS